MPVPHPWDLTPKQAVELQKQLRGEVRTDLPSRRVSRVAGVDVAFIRDLGESVATVVVLSYPGLSIVESAVARSPTPFPYVPGLLSFREIPPLLKALGQLSVKPDLILVDGHGWAHPRRFGIACHLGLWLQSCTIGVGKSRLYGQFSAPGIQKGEVSYLTHREEIIGKVLRTRAGVKPIFVSVGYGMPLDSCVRWVLRCSPRFRIPEPIRQAHNLAANRK